MNLRALLSRRRAATLLLTFLGTLSALAEGTFVPAGPLTFRRHDHTATLLPNGKVLVVGGTTEAGAFLSSAELFDPATGKWSQAGNLLTGRRSHTATLLPTGRVLIAGGYNNGAAIGNSELYDPVTKTWTVTGSLVTPRYVHTATLLKNGKVLIAGGSAANGVPVAMSELYDPSTGLCNNSGALATARYYHTATLLTDGKVLVAGGNNLGALPSAELYDPTVGAWTGVAKQLTVARYYHTATLLPNGAVLVAGGSGASGSLASAELFDPKTGAWTTSANNLTTSRYLATATLLPNGKVLVTGGELLVAGIQIPLTSSELFDPTTGNWTATALLPNGAYFHTATLLASGQVLVAGGFNDASSLSSAAVLSSPTGNWNSSGSAAAHVFYAAALLPNGKVLAGGGWISKAQLYDPATGQWTSTGPMTSTNGFQTATLLHNGKVLVIRGEIAELYDPVADHWSLTSILQTFHSFPTITLLPDGKALLLNGPGNTEIYDPVLDRWTRASSPSGGNGTATLLATGKVLVAGDSPELYDPATDQWIVTGAMITRRSNHTATLLADGRVLVAGGEVNGNYLSNAELFDPTTGLWTPTGSLNTARYYHSATLLPDGKVLVAGGITTAGAGPSSAEVYDPNTGVWIQTANLPAAFGRLIVQLLSDGKVLVAGADNSNAEERISALYDVHQGVSETWRPQLNSVAFDDKGRLVITGAGFRGISSASSGNGAQDSPSNVPIVQLRRLDNEQITFMLPDPGSLFSDTRYTSVPLTNVPLGPHLVTLFVNGIPSPASILTILEPLDISVDHIIDGGSRDLGIVILNTSQKLDFTIKNEGGLPLVGLALSLEGPSLPEFKVAVPPASSLAPGAVTTFSINFLPTSSGVKSVRIQIASNVPDKNPYDIDVTATAVSFADDTDADGLNDASEYLMASLGFNWQVSQPELVQTLRANATGAGLYNQDQFDANRLAGRIEGRADVTSSPGSYNLYTLQQFDANRVAGRTDVTSAPNNYGLYDKAQYDANRLAGRVEGRTDVTTSPASYSLYTLQQFDANRLAGQADVTSAPNSFGLYTLNQIQALNVGSPLIAKDQIGNNFKLTVAVQKAPSVNSPYVNFPLNAVGAATQVNTEGKLEFRFTLPDDAAFFRLESK